MTNHFYFLNVPRIPLKKWEIIYYYYSFWKGFGLQLVETFLSHLENIARNYSPAHELINGYYISDDILFQPDNAVVGLSNVNTLEQNKLMQIITIL